MVARILFVDDDRLVVKSIERLLRKVGYQVDTARSGREALEKITVEDFDLIICDVRMPGIGGLEMIERARDHFLQDGKPHPPEILISGDGSQKNFQKARALRAAAYLYKPFDVTEFLSAVSMALWPSSREGESPLWGALAMDEKAPLQRPSFGFKTSRNML